MKPLSLFEETRLYLNFLVMKNICGFLAETVHDQCYSTTKSKKKNSIRNIYSIILNLETHGQKLFSLTRMRPVRYAIRASSRAQGQTQRFLFFFLVYSVNSFPPTIRLLFCVLPSIISTRSLDIWTAPIFFLQYGTLTWDAFRSDSRLTKAADVLHSLNRDSHTAPIRAPCR